MSFVSDNAIIPLWKTLKSFCTKTGYTEDSVFEGLLDYMIGFLNCSLTPEPIKGWRFKPEDSPVFREMMSQVCQITAEQIEIKGWYDPFGDLYMALHSNGGGKGQFFTPPSVAQMVASTNMHAMENNEKYGTHTPFGHRIVISDPAAGSGRLVLAGYTELIKIMQRDWGWDAAKTKARRPYISVEDLDYNCVKMAALNICLHGAFGEAVCHDTLLEPDAVRMGYIINETMWPFPTDMPSIRREDNPQRFVCTRQWMQRKDREESKQPQQQTDRKKSADVLPLGSSAAPEAVMKKKEPVQLTLF